VPVHDRRNSCFSVPRRERVRSARLEDPETSLGPAAGSPSGLGPSLHQQRHAWRVRRHGRCLGRLSARGHGQEMRRRPRTGVAVRACCPLRRRLPSALPAGQEQWRCRDVQTPEPLSHMARGLALARRSITGVPRAVRTIRGRCAQRTGLAAYGCRGRAFPAFSRRGT
jgi:hypothetical protein